MENNQPSFFYTYGLYMAWIVAVVATGSSLYLSDVLDYTPCKLCWFQRIFMYPQVILLGIAAYRGDRRITGYVLPLSIIGGLISIYHYLEQKVPGMADIMPCTDGVPCSEDYLDYFGVITIPLMALVAFILITGSLWLTRRASRHEDMQADAE
ncbi:disulfide bond formation protein DsbB [Paenibacillus curdlanolyticus YK9]|uniref:Disulfide bond formation protein DsbB n=1 Tax=Paenibacillus curdlanolyticus YK9 TaxID=717606 RepID=E0I9V6_9BACL|nr:disulfide oxidoreductase [Paenibacillus curdlanolyticus]EFM10533.1 disulfide bond formation protein DsbB [Paenibacillus curdlanolyticus YK9]